MTGPSRLTAGRDQRRALRHAQRRRRRGGDGRGPVVLQRSARALADTGAALRRGVGRLVAGDRPLVVVLLGAVVLSVVMLSGPAQRYLDGQERVEGLRTTVAAVEAENRRLGQRVEDLNDPANIELLAREQQGFIRPGEVPYTLVPPEVERPRITAPRDRGGEGAAAWYARAWERVRDLISR